MVSSISSWLGGLLGQGETVEWLLSGLLLIHLLVILFFVFSRGNASAFLQWVLNRLPELEAEAMPGWSSEWCHPAAGLSSFHHTLHYVLEGSFSAVFPPLLVWRRARATVKDGSKDTLRWKIMPCLTQLSNFVVLYDIVRCFMVLICIDTVDVILSDGRDTGSGTIINIHIK